MILKRGNPYRVDLPGHSSDPRLRFTSPGVIIGELLTEFLFDYETWKVRLSRLPKQRKERTGLLEIALRKLAA